MKDFSSHFSVSNNFLFMEDMLMPKLKSYEK